MFLKCLPKVVFGATAGPSISQQIVKLCLRSHLRKNLEKSCPPHANPAPQNSEKWCLVHTKPWFSSFVCGRQVSAGTACFLCALSQNSGWYLLNACGVEENTLCVGIRASFLKFWCLWAAGFCWHCLFFVCPQPGFRWVSVKCVRW